MQPLGMHTGGRYITYLTFSVILEPVFGNQRLHSFKVLRASFVSKRRHPSMINDCLSHTHIFVCSGVKFVAAACFFVIASVDRCCRPS